VEDKKNWIIAILAGLVIVLSIAFFGNKDPNIIPSIPISSQQSIPSDKTKETRKEAIIPANEAWEHIGEIRTVEYYVANPYRSGKGNVFLNEKKDYKTGFTTVIFAVSVNNFGDPIALYGYKTVRTTGLIKMYHGHPEIIVDNPNQIGIAK